MVWSVLLERILLWSAESVVYREENIPFKEWISEGTIEIEDSKPRAHVAVTVASGGARGSPYLSSPHRAPSRGPDAGGYFELPKPRTASASAAAAGPGRCACVCVVHPRRIINGCTPQSSRDLRVCLRPALRTPMAYQSRQDLRGGE